MFILLHSKTFRTSPVTSPNNPSSFLTSQLKLCVSCACHNPRRLMPLGFWTAQQSFISIRKIISYILLLAHSIIASKAG